jgi:hypothetical protein
MDERFLTFGTRWRIMLHDLEVPLLVLMLSQMKPVHTTPSYFSKIHFIIILQVFLAVSFLLDFLL